jgi:hypothetical protein
MWNWIILNKQWVFSGFGVSIVMGVLWLLRRTIFGNPPIPATSPPTPAPSQNNANSVIQSPVINLNVPLPSPPSEPRPEPQATSLPQPTREPAPEEERDLRPKIYSLHPRIANVSEVDPDEGNGIVEGGNQMKAVVATFRMKKPSPDVHDTYLTARLSYRKKEDIGIRDIEKEIHRVNYGTWLDEEFNFVEMAITDTKELVLALQVESGVCVAVQDNRHSTTKYNGLAYHKLEPNGDSFFVDVTLVDGNHGPVIAYSYKIDVDHLRVSEIIRVPKL